MLRGAKYIMGSLPDMGFEIIPVVKTNPLELHLKIWWTDVPDTRVLFPAELKIKLEKIEDQLAKIGLPSSNTQIPKPIADDGAS